MDAGPTNFNLTTTYERDAVGEWSRRGRAGNDTLHTVNALNQVVREQWRPVDTTNGPASAHQRDFFYDANANLVRSDAENRDEAGALVLANPAFTTTFAYDILDDRLSDTQEVDAGSSVVTANAYDANQDPSLTRFGEATAAHEPFNTVQTLRDERDLVCA